METALLEVRDLAVGFGRGRGRFLPVIDTANLSVAIDSAVGIVGESGSGKTMLCRSIIGTLARRGAAVTGGSILFAGQELVGAPEHAWRQIRGRQIGYVPQSSQAGLNPLLTVQTQLVEALQAARPISRDDALGEALRLLDLVRIPRARSVMGERAHQLSGGMRQRVMIAGALAQRPKLLVADEPTTALDVTVQREILDLVGSLRRELGMALILVSHDLSVIEKVCQNVVVMYAGATMESGPVDAVVHAQRHPYSLALRTSRVDKATPGEDLREIAGDPPAVGAWPTGCRFWPRCPLAEEQCRVGQQPGLRAVARQMTACLRAEAMAGA